MIERSYVNENKIFLIKYKLVWIVCCEDVLLDFVNIDLVDEIDFFLYRMVKKLWVDMYVIS